MARLELLFVREKSNQDVVGLLNLTERNIADYKIDLLTRLCEGLRARNLSVDVFPELAGLQG